VKFPWPPRALSPNARVHWAVKAKAAKSYRLTCFAIARAAKASAAWEGDIHLRMGFAPPDNRHRDDDNMIAACKSLRDGLADALGVNDRRFRLHSAVLPPMKGGAVLVELSGG